MCDEPVKWLQLFKKLTNYFALLYTSTIIFNTEKIMQVILINM